MTREELEQIEDVKVLEEEHKKVGDEQRKNDLEISRLEEKIGELKKLNRELSSQMSYLEDRINRKGKHQCSKRLYGTWDIHGHLCEKTAKVCRNGVWYCGIHDPERGKK